MFSVGTRSSIGISASDESSTRTTASTTNKPNTGLTGGYSSGLDAVDVVGERDRNGFGAADPSEFNARSARTTGRQRWR